MENKENQLTIIDENGNEILCEVLFTFNSEEFNKNYVVFYPVGSEEEDGTISVMAASYVELEDGTCGELSEVTDEKDENKKVILKYNKMTVKQKKQVIERIKRNNAKYAKIYVWTKDGHKYYTTSSERKTLQQLGITSNILLKNKKLVKALLYAINKNEIVYKVYNNLYCVAEIPLQYGSYLYRKEVKIWNT